MGTAARRERQMITRGTPEHEVGLPIVANLTPILEGHARRINGRYLKVYFVDIDASFRGGDIIVGRWKRLRIPRGHPWRGKRP